MMHRPQFFDEKRLVAAMYGAGVIFPLRRLLSPSTHRTRRQGFIALLQVGVLR